jgi:protein TonB
MASFDEEQSQPCVASRRTRRWGVRLASVALALLGGCSGEPAPEVNAPAGAAPAAAASVATEMPAITATVSERAEAALRANRLFTPPGDNAFELFLQAVEAEPDNVRTRNALQDMYPYAVINIEQRLASRDRDEVARMLALMVRAQPDAPALPRLKRALEGLDAAMEDAREQELAQSRDAAAAAARAAASAQPPASTVAMATAPPTLPSSLLASAAPVPREASPRVNDPPAGAMPTSTNAPATTAPPQIANASARTSRAVPAVRRQKMPRYPVAAFRRKVEGRVDLAFTITTEGRVDNVQVVSSEPPGVFDDAAIEAIEGWRYEPPSEPVRATRMIEFKLQ